RGAHIAKRNTWAPIYLRLEMLREYKGGAQLKIEAADADDLKTTLFIPILKNLSDRNPGEKIESTEFAFVPYVRSGDRAGGITLRVVTDPPPGDTPDSLSDSFRIGVGGNFVPFRDLSTYVVLSLGSNLPNFALSEETGKGPASGTSRGGLRGGRVETAAI